jgi:hypothetical protein
MVVLVFDLPSHMVVSVPRDTVTEAGFHMDCALTI